MPGLRGPATPLPQDVGQLGEGAPSPPGAAGSRRRSFLGFSGRRNATNLRGGVSASTQALSYRRLLDLEIIFGETFEEEGFLRNTCSRTRSSHPLPPCHTRPTWWERMGRLHTKQIAVIVLERRAFVRRVSFAKQLAVLHKLVLQTAAVLLHAYAGRDAF